MDEGCGPREAATETMMLNEILATATFFISRLIAATPPSAPEKATSNWLTSTEFWAVIAALIAAIFAGASAIYARRQNRIAATEAWAQVAIRLLEEELQNSGEDAVIFQAIFGPSRLPSLSYKQTQRDELMRIRDESARRLTRLRVVVPSSNFLISLKARRDDERDSFLDNSDLQISEEHRAKLLKKYEEASAKYARAIRRFAIDLIHRGLLEAEELPEQLKRKYEN